jgi:hypothetical protein
MLDLEGLDPNSLSLDKHKSGAVDTHTRTMEDAVTEFLVIFGFDDFAKAKDIGAIEK